MRNRKNLIIRVVVIIICLLMVLGQVMIIFGEESSTVTTSQFLISVYNDITDEYIVSNTRYEIPENKTVNDAIFVLEDDGVIKHHTIKDGALFSIVTSEDVTFSAESQTAQFNLKINGNAITSNSLSTSIQNGDVIEFFYSTKSLPLQTQSVPTTPVKKPNTQWNSDLAKIMSNSFEWLSRNIKTSEKYLITAGVVQKTADIKTITSFENSITKTKVYASPIEIANTALSLSFCGFDASAEKYGQLIGRLESFANMENYGVNGALAVLLAYDCNKYDISKTAVNSRKSLVDIIVNLQNTDGGFSANAGEASDLKTTADCLTALSSYAEQSEVQAAIDKGVEFFLNRQTDTGGFLQDGNEDAESLASVIIALNSIGIDLDDARFSNGLALVDNLLQYRNSDDGFATVIDEKSTTAATERALFALASIKSGTNPYVLTTLVPKFDNVAVDGVQMEQDYANTIILVGAILGVVAVGAIVFLFITRKKRA